MTHDLLSPSTIAGLTDALRSSKPLLMKFDGIAALSLLTALQRVLSDPEFRCGLTAERNYRIARVLEAHLVEHAPDTAELIRKGWDRGYDAGHEMADITTIPESHRRG
jgi:hypothetical protein